MIKFIYFNGCIYKLELIRDFKVIFFGNELKFVFYIGFILVKSDLVFRWYVIVDGFELRIIFNIVDESLDFVVFLERRKIWDRFGNNDVIDLKKVFFLVVLIFLEIVGLNEFLKLFIDSEWVVLGELGLEEEISFLVGKLVC